MRSRQAQWTTLGSAQVLQLFGVIPKSSQRRESQPCLASGPYPPYAASVAGSTSNSSSRSHVLPLVHWLTSHGADIQHVAIGNFSGLRGLQAIRAFNRHDVILAVPTNLTVSFSTFSAAHAAAHHPRLQQLLALPDGDTYLEVVALLHEALLHGYNQAQLAAKPAQHTSSSSRGSGGPGELAKHASAAGDSSGEVGGGGNSTSSSAAAAGHPGWDSYLATLPDNVPLPVLAGASSSSPCTQLITALPHLHRLTSKRHNGLKEAWPRVQALLKALPKPSAQALARLNRCEAWRAFLWAYSTAQTRSVTLEVEELRKDMRTALQQQGVEDVGVLVPLLDMANHGSGDQVNARVLGDGTAFRLVATQQIEQGQQIFISYNPSDNDSPHCSWRWLLEYGFTIQQQQPDSTAAAVSAAAASPALHQHHQQQQQEQGQKQHGSADVRRQCYAFNLTAEEVLRRCLQPSPETAADAGASKAGSRSSGGKRQQWQQMMAAAGLEESSWWLELDGTGQLPADVLGWLGQLLTAVRQGSKEQQFTADYPAVGAGVDGVCGCGCSSGSEGREDSNSDGSSSSSKVGDTCEAVCVLRRILQQQKKELQTAVQAAEQLLQQQQAQSCPLGATAAAALPAAQQAADSCLQHQPASVKASGSSGGSSATAACPLEELVTVAWDGDRALAAAAEGLQRET